MSRSHRCAAVLGALLTGCASNMTSGSPSTAGWHELVTAHLVVQTDLSLTEARDSASLLEQLYRGLMAAAGTRAALPDGPPIQVVIFSNGIDFERLYGRTLSAVYQVDPKPRVVSFGPPTRWAFRSSLGPSVPPNVVVAAIAGILARRLHRGAPPWFLSGVGSYFATLQIDPDSGTVLVGKGNVAGYQAYTGIRSLKVAQLMRWDGKVDDKELTFAGYEGLSWATVQWLVDTRPSAVEAFSQAFAQGLDSETAWRQAVPAVSLSEADQEIYKHIKLIWHDLPKARELQGTPLSPPLSERALAPAEVDVLVQDLRMPARR